MPKHELRSRGKATPRHSLWSRANVSRDDTTRVEIVIPNGSFYFLTNPGSSGSFRFRVGSLGSFGLMAVSRGIVSWGKGYATQ